jgi:hypothetical protein
LRQSLPRNRRGQKDIKTFLQYQGFDSSSTFLSTAWQIRTNGIQGTSHSIYQEHNCEQCKLKVQRSLPGGGAGKKGRNTAISMTGW